MARIRCQAPGGMRIASPGPDLALHPVHLHHGAPVGQIVELLAESMVVPLDFRPGGQARFGQALIDDRRVG